jgi:hypothetical protein
VGFKNAPPGYETGKDAHCTIAHSTIAYSTIAQQRFSLAAYCWTKSHIYLDYIIVQQMSISKINAILDKF